MSGTWLPGHPKHVETELPAYAYPVDEHAAFAASLDWRTKAPHCTIIAIGATETFEDRRCVATGEDGEDAVEHLLRAPQAFVRASFLASHNFRPFATPQVQPCCLLRSPRR